MIRLHAKYIDYSCFILFVQSRCSRLAIFEPLIMKSTLLTGEYRWKFNLIRLHISMIHFQRIIYLVRLQKYFLFSYQETVWTSIVALASSFVDD